jgi:hypothetical protein
LRAAFLADVVLAIGYSCEDCRFAVAEQAAGRPGL